MTELVGPGNVRVLFLGDVFGKPGRKAVQRQLPRIASREQASFVIANCENVSAGAGVDRRGVEALLEAGVDVLTSGNHIWRRPEAFPLVDGVERLLRPANYPAGAPGRGWGVFESSDGFRLGIVNLIGRVFMEPVDCPFATVEALLTGPLASCPVIVDMHAEASSEKAAMGWFLAGRAAAVLGSHTHVQTADERLLPGGTAYVSDAGMCGPRDSVIGSKPDVVVQRFRSRLPAPLEVASGPVLVQGVVVEIERASGKAVGIERVQELVES